MRLSAERLAYGAPGGPVLREGLSVSLHSGEALHVVGDNGTGKSLLLRTLTGLLEPRAGRVENGFPSFRYLTQSQNRATHLPFSLGDVVGARWREAGLLTERHLGLAWNRASGGERQRALLSRFFGQEGSLLVLDEPFNHLDRAAKEKTKELIRGLFRDPSAALLLVSHDDEPEHWLPVPVRRLELGP